MRSAQKKAFAKINLTLEVGKKRPDGYHLITSVMARISLFDIVRVSENSLQEIRIFSNDKSIENGDNLALLAAERYFEKKGISGKGVDITLEKEIPIKSGLGGGSADAAATIEALEELYGALEDRERHTLALSLGADVPYCLLKAPALAKGIGDECYPILKNGLDDLFITVHKVGEKLSTGEMYKTLDNSPKKREKRSHESVVEALEKGDKYALVTSLFNDFEVVALTDQHVKTEEELYDGGAIGVTLSGAGPTLVAFFDEEEKAKRFGKVFKII